LLVTASVVPSSPILVTLMKEALSSSETSVLTRATRRNIPDDAILHSHRSQNLKTYRDKFRFTVILTVPLCITIFNKTPYETGGGDIRSLCIQQAGILDRK
jgi:hypothetical protein